MYYIDSSENPSNEPEDALQVCATLELAQAAALERAKNQPGTEFYVNTVVTTITQVYRAVAVINVESEVIAPPAQS